MQPNDVFSAEWLFERLRHKSPKVREWAASHLAVHGGPAELEKAVILAKREFHPDVLSELLDWFGERADERRIGALLDLGSWHARKGRVEEGARLLLHLLRKVQDQAQLRTFLGNLIGETLVPELLSLREACGHPEFYLKLKVLHEKEPGVAVRRVLAHMLPSDSGRGVHWAYGLAALWSDDVTDRWAGLTTFFPHAAGEEHEDEAACPSKDIESFAALLEACAAQVKAAPWICPALESARFAVALDRARQGAQRFADAVQELANALRWAVPHVSKLPEENELKEILTDVLAVGDSVEAGRVRLQGAADSLEAIQALLSLPLPELDGLESELCPTLAEEEKTQWAERLTRSLELTTPAITPLVQARALAFMGRLKGEGALPLFVERLGEEYPFVIRDQACDQIAALGPQVLDSLEPHLDGGDASRSTMLLEIFMRSPGEHAGRILARRAPGLFASLSQEIVVDALAATGSSAVAEPLLDAYRPGECVLARALILLADLHGFSWPVLRDLYEDVAQEQRRKARVLERVKSTREAQDLFEVGVDEPLWVALRCRQCRYEYHYQVDEIWVAHDFVEEGGPTGDALSFDRLIRCKRCASVEDYEFGADTMGALSAELMRVVMLDKLRRGQGVDQDDEDGEEPEEDGPEVAQGRLRFLQALSAGGRRFGNKREILRYLLEKAREHPARADTWKRLGNVYKNGGIPDLAEECYHKSLALDPDEMEAHLNLGELLMDKKEWEAAHFHLRRVLALGKNHAFAQRRDFVRQALHCLGHIQEKTDLRVFPSPEVQDIAGIRVMRIGALDLESDSAIDEIIEQFAGRG